MEVINRQTKYKPKAVPEIGKEYHFFDDGKITPMRHYMLKVGRIITPEDAKHLLVNAMNMYDDELIPVFLYDYWKTEVAEHDWIYNPETDYFVECSCPDYDDNNLWFIRTTDGGWFSMDIQSGWQGGRLDIDGSLYESLKEYFPEYAKSTTHD